MAGLGDLDSSAIAFTDAHVMSIKLANTEITDFMNLTSLSEHQNRVKS